MRLPKRPRGTRVRKQVQRVMGWYRYIPTSLTLGNSLCGFGAILLTLQAYSPADGTDAEHYLNASAWLILGAMIFDMLDGWTARLLNAFSDHGMQMDSLADMCTFGVAPAVVVAVMAHVSELSWLPYRVVWVMCAIYLGCAALRLALYNVLEMQAKQVDLLREARESALAEAGYAAMPPSAGTDTSTDTLPLLDSLDGLDGLDPEESSTFALDTQEFEARLEEIDVPSDLVADDGHGFHGLPSPGAAAAVCSLVILSCTGIDDYEFQRKVLAQLLPIYAAMLGLLMVSPIPYMHVGRWLGSRRRNKVKILFLLIFAGLFAIHPQLIAAIAINAYVLSGPVQALSSWLRDRSSGAADADAEPDAPDATP